MTTIRQLAGELYTVHGVLKLRDHEGLGALLAIQPSEDNASGLLAEAVVAWREAGGRFAEDEFCADPDMIDTSYVVIDASCGVVEQDAGGQEIYESQGLATDVVSLLHSKHPAADPLRWRVYRLEEIELPLYIRQKNTP